MQITYNSYAKYDMALYFTRAENPELAAKRLKTPFIAGISWKNE